MAARDLYDAGMTAAGTTDGGAFPSFHLTNGQVDYEGEAVFSHLSLTIQPGEFAAILGENGSGKTTLMKALLGLTPLSSGSSQIVGVDVGRFRDWTRVAYVPQRLLSAGAVPVSVLEVVRSARARPNRLFMGNADKTAAELALRKVNLWGRRHDRLDALSGGQQRRVMIAHALAKGADIFVLDEPTAGIDHESQRQLADVFSTLRDDGATVLLVTHELGVFSRLATRVIVMQRRGARSVAYDGPPPAPAHLADHAWHHSNELAPLPEPSGLLEP